MKSAAIFRWTGRCLSAGLIGLFMVFFVGEGPPPMFQLSDEALEFWLLVLTLAGLGVAWRYELAGALLALAGIGGFYLADFLKSGNFPRGWVFPMFALTPCLFLVAWGWRRAQERILNRKTPKLLQK